MYLGLIVTHAGPCSVKRELFEKIVKRKEAEERFGDQILFAFEIDLDKDGNRFDVLSGEVPNILTMEDFVRRFITEDPPKRRIIVE